jgi:2-keto-4-pentenoate hydratase/2-oxohepta-3-ene-1,7-dioic acid hydratase in catechol pathway
MKLIRAGEAGKEKPGIWLSEKEWVDVSGLVDDYNEKFWSSPGIAAFQQEFSLIQDQLPRFPEGTRLGPPVARPSKIVCIGLNYKDHAKESNMEIPAEPIVFFKSTTALVGPNDFLQIPRGGEKTDWEVELAVVIGKTCSYVSRENAMEYVAGYLLHNDYSERSFQLERGGQWVKGKSCDTFAPMGPYLATRESVPNVHQLRLWLKVNGETKQDGNTANLIFDVPYLVSYLSEFMTLLPGDIISTGTPAGVGLGFKPPQYVKPGDVIELGIDELGQSRQLALSYSPIPSV